MTNTAAGVQPLKYKTTGASKLRKPYPMYGDSGVTWLGAIPSQWEVTRGRFCMQVNPAAPRLRHLRPDHEVSFVPMESIGELGGMDLYATRTVVDCGSGFTEFQDNDVVVAKITPCFENWKGAIATNLRNGVAFGTTELHVLRARGSLDYRFLFYMTLSAEYRRTGEAEMYGAGGQKRVPPDFNKNFRLPTPPLVEQRAIASFLDRETGRIDALIAKKERQIELLQEKRQALITHAVTKGLDPKAKMKDSGVEWLGRIPEGWSVSRLKFVCSRIVDCLHSTPEYLEDGPYPAVRTADVNCGLLDLSNAKRVSRSEYQTRISRLKPAAGDLVYSREGERFGHAAMIPAGVELCVSQRMMHFRVGKASTPAFMMHQLGSQMVYRQAECDVFGSTSPHVNVETIRNFSVLRPPPKEQRAIAMYLEQACRQVEALASTIRASLTLLREYRTALISAAVTGKIDVREATAYPKSDGAVGLLMAAEPPAEYGTLASTVPGHPSAGPDGDGWSVKEKRKTPHAS